MSDKNTFLSLSSCTSRQVALEVGRAVLVRSHLRKRNFNDIVTEENLGIPFDRRGVRSE